jgi:trans-aconitate 2-methyltransferase
VTGWDPQQYQRFGDERARPFFDLLARVDVPAARRVVDLGCGPGQLTAALSRRWPAARVVGIDSSPEMLAEAKVLEVPGRLEFRQQDLREWRPDEPVDVLVANATLQWVPGHIDLLGVLAGHVAPGGTLAFQVPGNFEAPSHRAILDLRRSPRWRDLLGADADRGAGVCQPGDYLAALAAAGLHADVWETTYQHLLPGDDAVLEWVKGTALRPVLARLDGSEQKEFLAELAARLRAAYPKGEHGTLLPFRRIFAVGRRGGAAQPASVTGLDHVQVAIPTGGEDAARGYYADLLGLVEAPKPPVLAARGGCWFRGHGTEVHLGVEAEFRPARKAHVAFVVHDLDGLADRLAAAGRSVTWDDELAPRRRFYSDDPFGNRVELLAPQA